MQFGKIAIFLFSFFLSFVSMLSAQKKEKTIKIKGLVESVSGSTCSYDFKVKTAQKKVHFCKVQFPHLDTDEHCRKLVVGETVILEGHMDELNFPANHIWVHTSTIEAFDEKNRNYHLQGKVIAVKNAKNGYEAQIQTKENDDKSIFFAVVSATNLLDKKNYKKVKVGDTVKMSGELWFVPKRRRLTVRKID